MILGEKMKYLEKGVPVLDARTNGVGVDLDALVAAMQGIIVPIVNWSNVEVQRLLVNGEEIPPCGYATDFRRVGGTIVCDTESSVPVKDRPFSVEFFPKDHWIASMALLSRGDMATEKTGVVRPSLTVDCDAPVIVERKNPAG